MDTQDIKSKALGFVQVLKEVIELSMMQEALWNVDAYLRT